MGNKKHHAEKKHKHEKYQTGLRWKKAYSILAISIVAVVVLGLVAFLATRNPAEEAPGVFVSSLGNKHINDPEAKGIQYNSDPPTSGPHYGEGIARWGVHTEPIPKGLMVHNLEDGGVVVSYKPDAPKEMVDKLAGIVGRYKEHVILAPYPGLDSPIALSAWTRILKLDTVDEAKIVAFIKAYEGIDHHVKTP